MHKISWGPSIVQAVMDFAENIVSNPVTIKLRREEESLDNIKQVSCRTFRVGHDQEFLVVFSYASSSTLYSCQ